MTSLGPTREAVALLERSRAQQPRGQSESGWHHSDNRPAERRPSARVEGTDLIVGTHGRHGLPKFFLGSVAERTVVTAPCPVVTVRPT
jgi:nucleotide-binding universal stress UspA family protein